MKGKSNGVPRSGPAEVKRVQLLQRLRKHHDARLVALLAPAGYGKTTLLAQFVRSSRRKVVWLTLDPGDQEVVQLVSRVWQGLVAQGLLPELPMQLHHAAAPPLEAVKGLMHHHLSDLHTHLLLVLDRTEHLSESSVGWLSSLLSNLPEGHQVLLAGHESPHLPVAQWASELDALILGPADLAFSEEESKAYMALLGVPWQPEVHQQTEGWPVGLRLKCKGVTVGVSAIDWIQGRLQGLPQDLHSRLPLLAGHPLWQEGMQLLDGSVLDRPLIRQLLRLGLPITRLEAGRYSPHSLLQEALDQLLQEQPHLHRQVHTRLARAAEKERNWLAALHHHLKVGNTPEALQVAEQLLPEQLLRADAKGMRSVLEKFQLADLTPALRAQLAFSLMNTPEVDQSHQLIHDLIQQGYRDDMVCLVMANQLYRQARLDELLQWTLQGLELARDPFAVLRLRRMQVIGLSELGRMEEAAQVCRQYVQEASETRNPYHMVRALSIQAGVYADVQRPEEGVQSYRTALEWIDQHQLLSSKGEVCHNLALTLADLDRGEEALQAIQDGLGMPPEHLGHWRPLLLGLRASVYAQFHLHQEALNDYREAIDLAFSYGWQSHSFIYILGMADSSCMLGDFAAAEGHLARARVLLHDRAFEHQELLAFSEGLLALCQHNLQQAETLLTTADSDVCPPWTWAVVPFLQAEVARRQGMLSETHMAAGFERLAQVGNDGPLFQMKQLLENLYRESVQQGWFADRLAAVLNRQPVSQVPHVRWHLRLRTLGRFAVQVQDAEHTLSLRKCEALLVHLALQGPCSRDSIIDALWDGEHTSKVIDHCKVLIRKLRLDLARILQVPFDPVPHQAGMYRLHPGLQVECDTLDFLAGPQHLEDMNRWLNLYQGDFFPRLSSEWADGLRLRCQDLLIEKTLEASHATPDGLEAVRWLKLALRHCPTSLELYEALLVLLKAQGAHQEHARLHERYRQMLQSEYVR